MNFFESTKKKKSSKIVILTHASNRDALFNPSERNKPSDRYTIGSIIKYLERKGFSITLTYEEWYKVAMAIANTFTYDIGENYFLRLSSIDKEKYNVLNCKKFLASCYESRSGVIKFNTLMFLANQKGYFTKNQRGRGTEAVDECLS
ncbi:MAG: PriCT-2 domain-containing protein [Ignavibacteriales bacterium]|nr:PriCT-2 domain-containing protein [Ignavibacteriales bacterium]